MSEELQRKKQEEEEADMLINEQLKEVWNKQEKQSRLRREARNRLMKEVIETQLLQIQQKREKTVMKLDLTLESPCFHCVFTVF